MPAKPSETIEKIRSAVGSVFLGKPEVIEGAMVALLGSGHALIEDVPGVGKTLLAQALARCLGGTFRRIQFTPDLLPSDIIGTRVYNMQRGEFHFEKGPLFANIVLADEINRTSPRTQSALLEAMNDAQVSVDGQTYLLERPFLVFATQNPFEIEGTYLLPESQLDRFMIRLTVGYPPREEESRILADHREGEPIENLQCVVGLEELLQLQQAVGRVTIRETLSDYVLDIVHATRQHEELEVGVSTRGAIMLYRAAQSLAMLRDRDFVVPDDVKEMVVPVFAHRVMSKSFVRQQSSEVAAAVLRRILEQVPVPE